MLQKVVAQHGREKTDPLDGGVPSWLRVTYTAASIVVGKFGDTLKWTRERKKYFKLNFLVKSI